MKLGVIVFPGSNCDQDLIKALKNISNAEVVSLWHKDTDLQNCDMVLLPGGFSYGDYLRSGAIAKLSPIMNSVIEFANKGGKVLGICNGFQILCESGLLPGALLRNENRKFICDNVYIKASNQSAITSHVPHDEALKIPIAHGEGRFYADEATLAEILANDQVIFRYCHSDASINQDSNPNGSINNIAGICNKNKNVFGMMPHPERAADPALYNTDGIGILKGLIESISVGA